MNSLSGKFVALWSSAKRCFLKRKSIRLNTFLRHWNSNSRMFSTVEKYFHWVVKETNLQLICVTFSLFCSCVTKTSTDILLAFQVSVSVCRFFSKLLFYFSTFQKTCPIQKNTCLSTSFFLCSKMTFRPCFSSPVSFFIVWSHIKRKK